MQDDISPQVDILLAAPSVNSNNSTACKFECKYIHAGGIKNESKHHLPDMTDTGKTVKEDAKLTRRRDLEKTMALDSITIASLEGLTRLGGNEWKINPCLIWNLLEDTAAIRFHHRDGKVIMFGNLMLVKT